jgi:hypothetical protein
MPTSIESEVLDATADDWESLEQIFLSVRFEFISDTCDLSAPSTWQWRERNAGITLGEIAESITSLVQSGALRARREDNTDLLRLSGDDVLKCWFRNAKKG